MDKKYHFARQMRKAPTCSEDRLWEALRDKKLAGIKFRRQHLIRPYIVDFYAAEKKLVIEVDGEIHGEEGRPAADAQRQRYLEDLGYQVIRFTAQEVMKNLEGVVVSIRQVVLS